MAIVKGALQVTGGIKGVSFYSISGSDKVIMRTKGGPTKRRMKVGPEFEKVRKHQAEWAACVMFSNHLNYATGEFKKLGDYNVSPVWNGIGKKLINLDKEHETGQRSLCLSHYPLALEGFNMNRNFTFNAVFRALLSIELNKKEKKLTIQIPRINTANDLYNVQKLPYFRLQFSLGIISDIVYFENENYKPYKFMVDQLPAYSQLEKTEWLSTNDIIESSQFEIILDTDLPDEEIQHLTFLASAAIEFARVGFAGQIEPVKRASAAKILLAESCK